MNRKASYIIERKMIIFALLFLQNIVLLHHLRYIYE